MVDVQRLRALLAAATQYPAWGGWPDPEPSRHGSDHFTIGDAPPFLAAVKREEDAALISAMHRALPELLAIAEASEWQPIDSAPKDGTHIWLATPGSMRIAFWHTPEGRWIDFGSAEAGEAVRGLHFKPTHWMPLPKAPETVRLVRDMGDGEEKV